MLRKVKTCAHFFITYLGDLYTESGQTLQCSFSSVSTPPIARVGAFFSIFRDLQDFHAFAPLRAQNFGKKLPYFLPISTEKSQKIAKFRSKFGKFSRNFAGISRKFRGAKRSRPSRVLPGFFPTFFSFLPGRCPPLCGLLANNFERVSLRPLSVTWLGRQASGGSPAGAQCSASRPPRRAAATAGG